jgi:hypothetical protein
MIGEPGEPGADVVGEAGDFADEMAVGRLPGFVVSFNIFI